MALGIQVNCCNIIWQSSSAPPKPTVNYLSLSLTLSGTFYLFPFYCIESINASMHKVEMRNRIAVQEGIAEAFLILNHRMGSHSGP